MKTFQTEKIYEKHAELHACIKLAAPLHCVPQSPSPRYILRYALHTI